MPWLVLILALLLNAGANILMKLGSMNAKGMTIIQKFTSWQMLSGLVCFGLALVAYTKALESAELCRAYPIMTSAGFVIIVIFSWLYLKENISLVQWTGLLFLIVGIWLTAYKSV
jgi:multidrug transporter EmrE-like cation transporter